MADQLPNLPLPGYPDENVVTFYSDGVTTINPSSSVVRMYFGRIDGNFIVGEPNRSAVVAQVIMPTDSFVQMSQFFENVIQVLVRQGVLTAEHVNSVKSAAGAAPPPNVA